MDSSVPGVHPQHALAVYAESLAADARVAVFGNATLGLGAKLAELGARSVHFWDPDAQRAESEAERAPRGVTIRTYSEHDPDLRPIDLAIVADLGLFDDPSAIVRRVRRMVGEEGVAIIAACSAEAGLDRSSAPAPTTSRSFDYYDLFDLVAPEFDSVRMVAQLPFYGVALVELGDEDEAPGVNVDTQLGETSKSPEAFVVVASQRGARLEPYTIVQLPSAPLPVRDFEADEGLAERVRAEHELARAAEAESSADREAERSAARDAERAADRAAVEAARKADRATTEAARASDRAAMDAARAADRAAMDAARAADREALTQAQLRTELLAGQVEDLRRQLAEGDRATEAVAALEEALRARSAHGMELETSLTARGRELAELSMEVEEMRAAAEAGRIAAAQVEEVALRSDRAERRVAALELELAKGNETTSRELADLERVLRERAQAVRELEAELARREQMVRDLVGTLEEAEARLAAPRDASPQAQAEAPPAASPENAGAAAAIAIAEENARLRAQLDLLALDLARREGEAQAMVWQVMELERRLAQFAEPPVPSSQGPDRQLDQALDQLDALRTAFAQEHEARTRAESGEELARAQGEIQRQAVLMEQLVRELGSRPPPPMGETFGAAAVGGGDPASDSSEDSR
jgi:hypothetical protein